MPINSRLLFVSHSNGAHGAELCLAETVSALKMQGCNEIYVALPKGGIYLESLLRLSGTNIIHFNLNPRWVEKKITWKQKLKWFKRTIVTFIKFRRLVVTIDPDYVVTNTIVCNPSFAFAARICGCRHAWYIHELGDKDHGYSFFFGKRLTWFIVRLLSDKVIFNSQFTRDYFIGKESHTKKKIRVIYYGVPIERFKEEDECFERRMLKKWNDHEPWKLLVAGRTVEGKGQEDIIIALGILKNFYHRKDFHLTILGKIEGAYYDKLCDLVKKHDLSSHVSFVYFTNNPARYFSESHIGITTSRNEAFGRITVEYMKSNMVVVGGNAGGTCEIIQDNINGYLYSPGDMDNLARLILNVFTNPASSEKLANESRIGIEQSFNLNRHGIEIADFLFK